MVSPVWTFFTVPEEDNTIAVCSACSARVLRGGKKTVNFNTTILMSSEKSSPPRRVIERIPKQQSVVIPLQQAFENTGG